MITTANHRNLIELSPAQFAAAVHLFHGSPYGVLAAGTLNCGHPGRVFVDSPQNPSVGLVCTQAGYYFLAGRPQTLPALYHLFTGSLAPEQVKRIGDPQILLFYDSPAWKEPLFNLFADRNPISIRKKRMTLPAPAADKLRSSRARVPEGFRLVPFTASLIEAHPDLLGEVNMFWGSASAFMEKSLGVAVLEGSNLAGSCSAVFIGGGEAELSVFTVPQRRRMGLARAAATALIEKCLSRGLCPIWGCFPENRPSVALAHSLDYQEDLDQEICFWEYR